MNEKIKVPEVRVIDDTGKMVGIMPTPQALELARSQGLDLIEVSPKANPPVVRILSYDKYRYHLDKAIQQQKKKQKKIEVKGIRLSIRIGTHDLRFKADQADKFLIKGNKVKVELILRGRERANVDFAFSVFEKFMASVSTEHAIEQHPKKLGNIISAIIVPKV